jgi:hypothetical protein
VLSTITKSVEILRTFTLIIMWAGTAQSVVDWLRSGVSVYTPGATLKPALGSVVSSMLSVQAVYRPPSCIEVKNSWRFISTFLCMASCLSKETTSLQQDHKRKQHNNNDNTICHDD